MNMARQPPQRQLRPLLMRRLVLLLLGVLGVGYHSSFLVSSSASGQDDRLLVHSTVTTVRQSLRRPWGSKGNENNEEDDDGGGRSKEEEQTNAVYHPDRPTILVDNATRDLILEQQYRWCIQSLDIHGFQMLDSSNCWSPARHMMVTHLNATALYTEVYQVALDPLELLTNQTIRVVGDSISRYFVTALYYILLQDANPAETIVPSFHWTADEFHGTIRHVIPSPYNIELQWQWAPGAKEVRHYLESLDTPQLQTAHHNIIMIGNWYRTKTRQKWFRDAYKTLLHEIRSVFPLMHDLVLETPPRHPADHPNDTLAQEESFNIWWAQEISSRNSSSTHGNATPVPVVNGFWPFHVDDEDDGIHSVTHALYSAFLHLWRWRWLQHSPNDKNATTTATTTTRASSIRMFSSRL